MPGGPWGFAQSPNEPQKHSRNSLGFKKEKGGSGQEADASCTRALGARPECQETSVFGRAQNRREGQGEGVGAQEREAGGLSHRHRPRPSLQGRRDLPVGSPWWLGSEQTTV